MSSTNPDVFAEIGTLTDHEGLPAIVFRDYNTLVLPSVTIEQEQFGALRRIIDNAERAIIERKQRMAEDEAASLDHEAWRDGEGGQ